MTWSRNKEAIVSSELVLPVVVGSDVVGSSLMAACGFGRGGYSSWRGGCWAVNRLRVNRSGMDKSTASAAMSWLATTERPPGCLERLHTCTIGEVLEPLGWSWWRRALVVESVTQAKDSARTVVQRSA